MIADVIKEVHTSVVERVTSPLLGSFAVSWCLWNYKFLLIVLSEEPVARSFEMISTLAYPDATALMVKGVAGPLMTALLYIFVYPYPAKFVFEYTRKRQREILEIKRRIEDETPLTLEESRKIRQVVRQQAADFTAERQSYQDEIASLRDELKKAKGDPPSEVQPPTFGERRASVTATQMELLRLLSVGNYTRESIVTKSADRLRTEFNLGELLEKQLIAYKPEAGSRLPVIRLTHEGRRVLLGED